MRASEDEVRALRQGAGVCLREDRAVLRLSGVDRVRFLNGMVTNDVTTLTPGLGLRAIKTTQKGRIEGVLRIRALDDAFEIDLDRAVKDRVIESFERLIIMDDCAIADHPDSLATLTVLGPNAGAVLEAAGFTMRPSVPHASVRAPDGVVIVRDDGFGVLGYDLLVSQAGRDALLARVVASGAQSVSVDALDVLRVEAGCPRDGVDLEEDTIPMEARLEDAISMTKGCYVGQEVIARATNLGGIKHILVGLRFGPLSAAKRPAQGAVLRLAADGRETGHVTSAVFSFALGEVIALGYVRKADDAPGTKLRVATDDGTECDATIATLPFLPSLSVA